MNNRLLISIILSFRNEESVLPELIRRLHTSLAPLNIDYELIFVNDASTDNSLNLLMQLAKEDKRIKIINTSRRFGIIPCTLAGIQYAKGDAVIYLDTDLQDPPEVIPQLIAKWQDGNDLVYTVRTSREGETLLKMVITKLGYHLLRLMAEDVNLPVNSGNFRLLSRQVVNEILKLNEKEPFLKGLTGWVGFKSAPVFYRRDRRFSSRTHFPCFRGGAIKPFIYSIVSFSSLPLYFAFFAGALSFLSAFVYLIVMLKKYPGINSLGWPIAVFAILLLGGIQLIGLGILGLYLGRVYNETKNRPNYIIKSTYGFDEK